MYSESCLEDSKDHLTRWLSTEGKLTGGIFDNTWKHFWLLRFGRVGIATVIESVEGRDAAKLPTMHRTVPATKNVKMSRVPR